MFEIKIEKSQKRKGKIIYKDYIYNLDRVSKSYINWRCVRRDCLRRIHSDFNKNIVIKEVIHWHEKENPRITKIMINKSLKTSGLTSKETFENSFGKANSEISPADKIFLGNYNHLSDKYIKLQNNDFNCKIDGNDDISESYKYTFDNNLFFQFDSGFSDPKRFLIFSTIENLNIMNRSNVWLSDGAFSTSPKNFKQIYIFYGTTFGKTIPLIYVFMKFKSQDCYTSLFLKIFELVKKSPEVFIIDFELAVFNSIKIAFRNTEIKKCNFHFTQIMVRFLQSEKLIGLYKNDITLKINVKNILILAYVLVEKVEHEFLRISENSTDENSLKVILFFKKKTKFKKCKHER
ncbi:hypothetical protein DMUE_3498 [Dictyocoela muelleri]|nr:hypothetical protein DMUE_3498 [Dictyocoela muelleri]